MMAKTTQHQHTTAQAIEGEFEAPQLILIGDAKTAIQGFPGTGWDGPYGMTEPGFEFEDDDARG